MCLRWLGEGSIDAWRCQENLECLFVDPFVGVDPTFQAFEVARGFSIFVFLRCWWLLVLPVEDVFDELSPCGFLGQWFFFGQLTVDIR